MPIISIRGKQVDVDIEAELREYSWDRERWTSDKLIACSPFRYDSHPSFFVNLETGGWADSGAHDDNKSGNILSLLGYLRSTDWAEAIDYLIEKYGVLYDLTDDSEGVHIPTPKLTYSTSKLKEIRGENVVQAVSPYVSKRGISPEVQREFAIGYGEGHRGFTAIPWYTTEGRLANVKYRSTTDKKFFYESNATPVKTIVYGLDKAKEYESVVVVEGEIDALSWWTAGIPSVAVGSAHMSDEQSEAIKREGFKRIYLGGDNDKQGRKLNRMVERGMRGYAEMYEIDYEEGKDANDVLLRHGAEMLRGIFEDAAEVQTISLRFESQYK